MSTIFGTQKINGIEITDKDNLFHINSIVILLFVHEYKKKILVLVHLFILKILINKTLNWNCYKRLINFGTLSN